MSLLTVLRSEWLKFRGLRSSAYTAAATVVVGIGLGLLIANGTAARSADWTPQDRAAFDPTATTLQSFILAQIAIGVLGVLAITSEYATGMIRTSLAVVPRRGRLLAAKALVVTGVGLAIGEVVSFGSFLGGMAMLRAHDLPTASLDQPGVLRAVAGCGLMLALLCLLAVGIGTLLRATAGAITAFVTVNLLVPLFAAALPESLTRWVQTYWPVAAGARIVAVVPDPDGLSPWAGLGLLAATVAAVLAVAYAAFARRDA